MRRAWMIAAALALVMNLLQAVSAEPIRWADGGKYRLLVKVEPRDIGDRAADEMPAELEIDFVGELEKLGVTARPDVASICVIPYDPTTGEPIKSANLVDQDAFSGWPFRWYDDAIPYEFPEFADSVTRTQGKIVRRPRTRGGHFFNAIGDWKRGRLVWRHVQASGQPSFYAVYFDLLASGQGPTQTPPRGWMGDGVPRSAEVGSSTMGADHCRIEVDDWNGDGLVDLVVGENYGHVFWWPNHGTREAPEYPYSKFVFDSKGMPLDAGMIAAPKVVDWDGDGNKDLLVGTEWNRVLYYRNLGSDRDRKLEYCGFVEIDGKPLQLPIAPLVRGSMSVFKRDYYPVLETVDFDGDGDADLLAGGYITGRIYFYENAGRGADGFPRLTLRGPLESDGKPLNVGHWCAAPCLVDLDDDGDLDLLSGNMPMYVGADDDQATIPAMLQYHENQGTREKPQFTARPFPADGEFPRARLATPRAVDWDADGDVDLVVSARENIYLFENQGTRERPRFRVDRERLPCRWGGSPLAVDQFRDWDGDGRLDLVNNYTVRLNSGVGNPWRWEKSVSVLPPGEYIEHPSGIGDDWFWPFLADLDQDGKVDVLFGDWFGHVWFHRNLSTPERRHFDVTGKKLTTTDGAPIKVGPIGKDPEVDFDALQGARTVLTMADFNRDGLNDLVVGDTYGEIRYFRNAGSRAEPVFDPPKAIGNLGIRLLVDATDWDQDGWIDVIAGAANGRVRVFLNNGEDPQTRFAPGIDPGLPSIIQPRTLAVDLNGDGDDDLFLPSTQGSCYVERSFLKAGYAQGVLIAVELLVPQRGAADPPRETPRMYYADDVSGRPFSKDPAVVKFKGKYWLYYSVPPYKGKPTTGWTIGVASSDNLVDWIKAGELRNSGEAEAKGFTAPGAIVLEGKVHLFYQTYGNGKRDAICHAWSEDGLNFTRNADNPIFRPTGSWNVGRAIDADVIPHEGRLLLYWATRDPSMKTQMLGVAAAPLNSDFSRDDWTQLNLDGPILAPTVPTKLDAPDMDLAWEKRCTEAAAMARHDGRLYMFYAGGYNNDPQQIGVAVSDDGVDFKRLSDKPLVPNGPPGSWNSSESGHPYLFQDDDGQDYLFYQGNNSRGKTWHLSVVPIDWKDGRPIPAPEKLVPLN